MEEKVGWLEKRADWKLVWNRRLFTLRGRTISYRENADAPDKRCAHIQYMAREQGADSREFRIWTEQGETWALRAETSEDYDDWTKAIRDYLLSGGDGSLSTMTLVGRLAGGVGTGEAASPVAVKGLVEKRSAWTHTWRRRYVMVEGTNLRYSEGEGQAELRSYIVVSCDPCPSDREVFVVTSVGDCFPLRLEDSTTARVWFRALRDAVRPSMIWRWQSAAFYAGVMSSVPDAPVRTAFHCAGHLASGARPGVLLWGGVQRVAAAGSWSSEIGGWLGLWRGCGTAASATPSVVYHKSIVYLPLCGDQAVVVEPVRPFEEGPGAKVVPAPRMQAACAMMSGRWFIHGGFDGSYVLDDFWCLSLERPNELAWLRLSVPGGPQLLPPLCGHTMTPLSPLSEGPAGGEALVCGGFLGSGEASRGIFLIAPGTNSASAATVPPFDDPRGGHSACRLKDGSVMVLGGLLRRNAEPAAALSSIVLWRPGARVWVRLTPSSELPPMAAPPVASYGDGALALLPLASSRIPTLCFLLPAESGAHLRVQQISCPGDSPLCGVGLTAVVHDEYLYLLGESGETTAAAGMAPIKRVLLPPQIHR